MEQEAEERQAMSMEQRQQLSSFWTGPLHWDVAMGDYCTLRAGGRAEALLEASTLAGTLPADRLAGRAGDPLAGDRPGQQHPGGQPGFCRGADYPGRRISRHPPGRPGSEGRAPRRVRVGAGCPAGKLVGWCARHGLAGLEFMAGIPGASAGRCA